MTLLKPYSASPRVLDFSLSYRRDIDGLRALAVGSVFLYHLDSQFLRGGFIGVDIFFVISGYLITNILMREHSSGGIQLARFYQRRIARLYPVMLLVTVSTLLVGFLAYGAQEYASSGVNAAAALLSVANFKFYLQGEYFSISPDSQPFLHFWSLSLEEQFYLLFPILLIASSRLSQPAIARALIVMIISSLLACILVSPMNARAAFYLLPFRAWELGIGALTAFVIAGISERTLVRWGPTLGVAGVMAVVASLFMINKDLVFPGYYAVVPVVGAAALIIAGAGGAYPSRYVFESRLMVGVGKMSYALYLWHWPVFSIVDYTLFSEPERIRIACKISLSVLFTLATYYFLERPTRRYLNSRSRRGGVFAGFLVTLLLMVSVGLSIRNEFYVNSSVQAATEGGRTFPGPDHAPTIVLMGDSVGSNFARTLRDLCDDLAFSLNVLSVAGQDSLPAIDGPAPALWVNALAYVKRSEPEVLVLANHWSGKLGDGRDARARQAIEQLLPFVGHIVLLGQLPNLPPEASRHAIREGARPPFVETPTDAEARAKVTRLLNQLALNSRVSYVDTTAPFLTREGTIRFTDTAGRQMFRDSRHLSDRGAAMLRRELQDAIQAGIEASVEQPHLQ